MAAVPMPRWQGWRVSAGSARWWQRASLAGLVHRRQLAAVKIEHPRREAALARDPAAHVGRIDVHQELRAAAAGDRPPVVAGMPGGMEPKPGAPGHADAVARDHAENHGAG